MNSFNLANPRYKVRVDELYVVFPIHQESFNKDRDENSFSYWYNDLNTYEVTRKRTVGFNRCVAYRKTIYEGDSIRLPKYEYTDLKTTNKIEVVEGFNPSEKFFSRFEDPGVCDYYGLPIRLDEFLKNNNIVLPEKISTKEAYSLIDAINLKDKDKKPVTLSFDKKEASKQINNILGKPLYDNVDDEVSKLINELNSLCKDYSGVFDNYVSDKIESLISSYNERLAKEKPVYKRTNSQELITLENRISPRDELVNKLRSFYFNLSSEISLVNYLSELYQGARIIISNNKSNEEENNNDSLKEALKHDNIRLKILQ